MNEDKEKESSPAGPAQETLGPEDLKKKIQNDRRAAKKQEEMKKVEESVKKANRNLEKKQRSTEAILEQQRQARMQADGSSTLAQKFRH